MFAKVDDLGVRMQFDRYPQFAGVLNGFLKTGFEIFPHDRTRVMPALLWLAVRTREGGSQIRV